MAAVPREKVETALKRKGFTLEPGDHRYYRLYVGAKKTAICTKVSMGSGYKTLGDQLVSAMATQLKLTNKEFHRLVDCDMSGEEYLKAMRDRGHVKDAPVAQSAPTASTATTKETKGSFRKPEPSQTEPEE